MKKLLSVLLVLALTMSFGITALAEPAGSSDITEKVAVDAPLSLNFQVIYQNEKNVQLGENAYPKEELEFQVDQVGESPAAVAITVGDGNRVTVNANPMSIPVHIPTYSVPGTYNYTIKEKTGNTQGVTYSDTTINVQVVVTNNSSMNGLEKQASFSLLQDGVKVKSMINTFKVSGSESGNQFTVQKLVTGNLADRDTPFEINVKLTKTGGITTDIVEGGENHYTSSQWGGDHGNELTITVALKHNETTTISGIPDGVDFKVTEAVKHLEEDASHNQRDKGYEVSYKVKGVTGSSGKIVVGEDCPVIVTNEKNVEGIAPATGVYLDALPYIILLAVAVLGLVAFAVKRRSNREY